MTSASSTGTDAKRKRNLPACLQIRENQVLCSRNADDVVEVNSFDCCVVAQFEIHKAGVLNRPVGNWGHGET
jgi:hypothetical protein